jgi:hypothetical protein
MNRFFRPALVALMTISVGISTNVAFRSNPTSEEIELAVIYAGIAASVLKKLDE